MVLKDSKESVLEVIEKRRQKTLQHAISVFNRNQSVTLKSWDLNVKKNEKTIDESEAKKIKEKQSVKLL